MFCRFGNRVRYRREDPDDWAETRRLASTIDDGTVLPGATPVSGGARKAQDTCADRSGAMPRGRAVAALAAASLLAGANAALATSDTTFGDPLNTVTDIVSGTGGQFAAALAVGTALVGSVLRFNAIQLIGAVGIGVAAGVGTVTVTCLVSTAIV